VWTPAESIIWISSSLGCRTGGKLARYDMAEKIVKIIRSVEAERERKHVCYSDASVEKKSRTVDFE
jgi:hypothetical protein